MAEQKDCMSNRVSLLLVDDEEGFVNYFGKPCELQELVRKIQEAVSKGR